MTQEQARKLFDKWVAVLGLGNWEIVFRWRVRGVDMSIGDSVGCTEYELSGLKAIVSMIAEEDYPRSEFEYDYERTLVHELMHLKLAPLDDSGDGVHDKVVHMLVEELARALVGAKRGEAEC